MMLFPTSFLQSGHTWSFQLDQTLTTAITNTEQPHKSAKSKGVARQLNYLAVSLTWE